MFYLFGILFITAGTYMSSIGSFYFEKKGGSEEKSRKKKNDVVLRTII